MSATRVVQLAQELIRFNSVSCFSNAAISDYVANHLQLLNFEIERVEYHDEHGVSKVNLIAKRGPGFGGIMYSAHTDVVPVDDWQPSPDAAFEPRLESGRLYGRGSCDMKGSLAAALAAAEQIDALKQVHPLYFCVSADEELGMVGARQIAQQSKYFREMVDHGTVAVVGEPTELEVYYAHKGTLLLTLLSHGKSAHTSSRDGINANDRLFSILPALEAIRQRTENERAWMNFDFDPPTLSWNWIIRNEPYASNITPSLAELKIFLRPMPNVDHLQIVQEIEQLAKEAGVELRKSEEAKSLVGRRDGALVQRLLSVVGRDTAKTACYATDGAVLQELSEIVICGPGSIAQAHRNDEWISLDQLHQGVETYRTIFESYTCR